MAQALTPDFTSVLFCISFQSGGGGVGRGAATEVPHAGQLSTLQGLSTDDITQDGRGQAGGRAGRRAGGSLRRVLRDPGSAADYPRGLPASRSPLLSFFSCSQCFTLTPVGTARADADVMVPCLTVERTPCGSAPEEGLLRDCSHTPQSHMPACDAP
ncbi:hypothetical protein SKAU_G00170670 [Synaphobranchus kaupii]|uniref:Uncharacterized protein n=1 Tax=Synaphobranchus kaupii TaxID=118154 RepID=A0A9Q1J0U0_SYNKA|nr:hypothetical protein SKAU_G00170670 [Synaphobranchus kaupii]